VLLLGLIWIVVTAVLARSELDRVRADVQRLRAQVSAGDLAGARATASVLSSHADHAHALTGGPAWVVAAHIPWAGAPLHVARSVAASVDGLSHHALPQLVDASHQLDPARLRRGDGSIDLAPIAAVKPQLDAAVSSMSGAVASVSRLPGSTWAPFVDHARTDLLTQLTALGRTVTSADLAARVVPPMLGQDGPRSYFVAFQNDAEARGTGGLPGAFAVVTASHGTVKFQRFEPDSVLGGVHATVELGAAYDQLYGGMGTMTLYQNGNLSPHFPYAAQIWASMWRNYSGQRVDGVVAVDPTALSYLLKVTGPVATTDGTTVDAANVVALTQSTVYAKYPGPAQNAQRRDYLLDVAKSVSDRLVGDHGDTKALVRAAGEAAGQRRLLVWSAHPKEEADLMQTAVSGAIPVTSAPYVGLSIVNDGGNKLDYYLDRSISWQRSSCGATRESTATITLTNNAPAGGLSYYVTARSDRRSYSVRPGDNRLEVSYFATSGALMQEVTVDGKPVTASAGSERGHPVYTVDLELPRGATRTIVLHLTEPAGEGAPVVLRQPLVRPLAVHLSDPPCR
jgi:hypothetical protein